MTNESLVTGGASTVRIRVFAGSYRVSFVYGSELNGTVRFLLNTRSRKTVPVTVRPVLVCNVLVSASVYVAKF